MERTEKVKQLVSLFDKYGLDGYLIPHNDAHDSEYIAECDERIEFISGFNGSNGIVFITRELAILWTDSRYFIQAEKQLEKGWIMKKMAQGEKPWFEYVAGEYSSDKKFKIGICSFLFDSDRLEKRNSYFREFNIEIIAQSVNLVDEIWVKKPSLPLDQIFIHEETFCGQSTEDKLIILGQKLLVKNNSHSKFSFLTGKLDEIAYILNLRGKDIPYNPVFFSYLVLNYEKIDNHSVKFSGTLFIIQSKISQSVSNYLSSLHIDIANYNDILSYLSCQNIPINLSKEDSNLALYQTIPQNLIINTPSPISLMKGVKNQREIQGFRDCHIRDGIAEISYFCWLEEELLINKNTTLTEYTAAEKIDWFRSQQKLNHGLSFDTISSIGPNAAIVHYKPEKDTAALMSPNLIYLLDSGGQYLDGTTDITRTIHFGTPTLEEKQAYTRVLLGNLDLERTKWPKNSNISGGDLDAIARRRLWEVGLDYGHGTGHGVGYFLNVHEGPHRMSKNCNVPFQHGMIVTDEPGFYKEGKFGIRIENCLLVRNSENIHGFMEFENLTLAPYDKNLMDFNLMNKFDIEYINQYHERVLNILGPLIDKENNKVLKWLENACSPIKF